jgi:hypothetical protein
MDGQQNMKGHVCGGINYISAAGINSTFITSSGNTA